MIGQVGELLAASYLREQGYSIIHLYPLSGTWDLWSMEQDKDIVLDNQRWRQLRNLVKGLPKTRGDRQTPDMIAQKNGETYLVEVKVGKSELRKYQEHVLRTAKEVGFLPMLVTIDLEIRAIINTSLL